MSLAIDQPDMPPCRMDEKSEYPVTATLPDIRLPAALYRAADGTVAATAVDIARPLPSREEALIGILPPLYPEWLGERSFLSAHGCRFAYVVGEMARGIASVSMVSDAAAAGLMAFFGSAGLPIAEIEDAFVRIKSALGPQARNWGANLIHSPQDPGAELAFAQLALRHGVGAVSASAFMRLSPAVVWLAAKGLKQAPDGTVARPVRIFAKVSRAEVARQFLGPAPEPILRALVGEGRLTPDEADLARRVPVAGDITAEADSGGHTDNRALPVLLPSLLALAGEIASKHGYGAAPRVGAAGGLGTPGALAAAFSAGAAYVVTGSINQCTRQSGLSADARALLSAADAADIAMAPAADMFELGVKVQVLKRGTMFAQRGQKLYDAYRRYGGLDALPAEVRADIETSVLGHTVDEVWAQTVAHFARFAPDEIARAERDPRHKMALIFRWYLFMGAQWARDGVAERRADYQIWCGPAMGGFNQWVRGTFLAPAEARDVVQIALNLIEGAAHVTRAHQLRLAGLSVPPQAYDYRPRPLSANAAA